MKLKLGKNGIDNNSIFKLLFVGMFLGFAPIFLYHGVMGIFGEGFITVEGTPVTGIFALVAAIIILPLWVSALSLSFWLIILLGLWLYRKYKPIILECECKKCGAVIEYDGSLNQKVD